MQQSYFVKTIDDFGSYSTVFGVSLDLLKIAYGVSKDFKHLPQAVNPPEAPAIKKSKQNPTSSQAKLRYEIKLKRAGIPANPQDIQVGEVYRSIYFVVCSDYAQFPGSKTADKARVPCLGPVTQCWHRPS